MSVRIQLCWWVRSQGQAPEFTHGILDGLNLVHKPLLPGEDSRLRAVLHLQLAENIGNVSLDCLLTEHQLFGNGSIRLPFRDQAQYIQFALG